MSRTVHYSGKRSNGFWERVKALPEGQQKDFVYMAGVALQDAEVRTLQLLEHAEAAANSRWDVTVSGGNA